MAAGASTVATELLTPAGAETGALLTLAVTGATCAGAVPSFVAGVSGVLAGAVGAPLASVDGVESPEALPEVEPAVGVGDGPAAVEALSADDGAAAGRGRRGVGGVGRRHGRRGLRGRCDRGVARGGVGRVVGWSRRSRAHGAAAVAAEAAVVGARRSR